ncbi:MAG: class I SAM-dependent methyltransferase [Desulfovibrio sp.]|jgi:SAM-dependent methyltransferase|nr:class I SAM-dependent methyltransferase [Desulfovibrio sp.]
MSSPEFDEFAQSYDAVLENCLGGEDSSGAVEHFARGKALYLAQLLGAGFSGAILDYGCGHGRVARHLLEVLPKAAVQGYDISEKTIASADPELRKRARLTSRQEDLAPSYDLVLAAGVLHHIPPAERPGFLMALKARLAPGGRLVFFEHNPRNMLTRRVVERCIFDKGVVLCDAGEMRALLAGAGLGVERLDYISFVPPALASLRGLERLLTWCPLGAQYAAVGRSGGGR